MGKARPYTACAVLARYGYGEGLETAVMGFTAPKNDKPPSGGNGGLTRPVGGLTLELLFKRDGSLTDCSSPVKHPTTLTARCWENSLRPVGEERGVALKSVQRPPIYGHAAHSREACRRTRKLVKSCRQRMAPSVISPCEWIRPFCAFSPHGFTISHLPLENKYGR